MASTVGFQTLLLLTYLHDELLVILIMQPIQTALCSFGMSGKVFHAPFIQWNPHFNLYGVWERTNQLATQQYPSIHSFRTLKDLLADKAIELVIVNTPSITHYAYAKMALLAGKHVVVEKPFTGTCEEAEELIDVANKMSLKLSVYHNRRFDSDYRTIKKILDQQLLGQVVEAEFHFDRFNKKLSPKTHKETPGIGVGALYDLGSHLVDQAIQLFGMPDSVYADIMAMRPQSLVDDYFELILYYPSKRVRLKASYLTCEALPGYVIHGTNGSFIKSKTNIQEEALLAGISPSDEQWGIEPTIENGLLHTFINGKRIRENIVSEKGNYGDFYTALFEAIRNNGVLPVNPEDALKVITIIRSAFKSNTEKRRINL